MVGNSETRGPSGGRGWLRQGWDALRASFGFLSAVAMLAAVALALGLPAADDSLGTDLPVLTFDSQSSARSLLETIATTTVAVAGLSFSVTVVAFTLASSQLSPRVLRSFRSDRLSQTTLALFLGTFVYSLVLLVRLGISGPEAPPPNLSMTLAVLLALAAFGTFAGFIAHIISMLQPSSVIASIHDDAVRALADRFPGGPGEPEDPADTVDPASLRAAGGETREIEAPSGGYLTVVDTGPIIRAASSSDAIVVQRVEVGVYVLPGQVIAEIRGAGDDEELERAVLDNFILDKQRTLVQDTAFPVRQLADIALKGLSPGINDPTTAENAMDAMGSFLIEFVRSERPSPLRVDSDGEPRLLTTVPELKDLIRLGFDQVRVAAESHQAVAVRMFELLALIGKAASREGIRCSEIDRQQRLLGLAVR
jgi:uncharacterized membrane protein